MFAKAATATKQLPSKFKALSLDMKFYSGGVALLLLLVLFSLLLTIFGYGTRIQSLAENVTPFMMGILASGVIVEVAQKLNSFRRNLWFSFLVAFLTFIAYSMARVDANEFINQLTSIDPGKLPEAQTLLTSLLLIPSWISILLFVLAVLLSVGMLVVSFQMARDKTGYHGFLWFIKFIGLLGVFAGVAQADELYKDRYTLVKELLKDAVVVAEYHPKTVCANVFPGERVADVGGGFVSVFSPAGGAFTTRSCKQPQETDG